MSIAETFRLAQERGCILKNDIVDGTPIYWIENQHFVGRPFACLEDVANFMQIFPIVWSGETVIPCCPIVIQS